MSFGYNLENLDEPPQARIGDTTRIQRVGWNYGANQVLVASGYVLSSWCPDVKEWEFCPSVQPIMWLVGKLTSIQLEIVDAGTGQPRVDEECTRVRLEHVEAPSSKPVSHSAGSSRYYLVGQYLIKFGAGCRDQIQDIESNNANVFVKDRRRIPRLIIAESDTVAVLTLRMAVRNCMRVTQKLISILFAESTYDSSI